MAEKTPVNVAIIGCGLIGAQWDAFVQQPSVSLTHAAGFSKHPDACLVAVCDQNIQKTEQAAQRWGARAYTDQDRLFAENPVDVAVIATSSAARWSVVKAALAANVKVLVIEKPLASTLAESRKLVAEIDAAGIKSVVNFSRHWDPSMRRLRDSLSQGEFGPIQRIVGTYGKGISNNGSHMIDLVAFLCNAKPVKARALGSPLEPGEALWSSGKDRALDAQIVFADAAGKQFHLTMIATDQTAFTCFELRVIGTRAFCELALGGRKITYTPVRDDPHYAGYTIPGEPEAQSARGMEAMDRMADEALQLALGRIGESSCDVHTALLTALTVEAVNLSESEGGSCIEIASLTTE
ncbi:Gfo/Idh/MocA family protein [Methylobacter sp.]|uniref:Gfo/Idh/MocA family protein n=1 Tax=Methylobacter sp. TaxID=2051955 RepID=UPI002FDC8454